MRQTGRGMVELDRVLERKSGNIPGQGLTLVSGFDIMQVTLNSALQNPLQFHR
jgi:hypothetical protein